MKTHARISVLRTGHRRATRASALVAAAVATLVALAGCSLLGGSVGGPTWDETKAEAIVLLDRAEAMLPADSVTSTSEDETVIACGAATAELGRVLTIGTLFDFDRTAWLDEVAAEYATDADWRIEKKVAADGSSDATTAVALFRNDGYYLRFGSFDDIGGGVPGIVLSVAGPCAPHSSDD